MERLDALSVREGRDGGKSYFTKIGAAFPNKDGKGYTVLLDAVPVGTDGQVKIMLREPLPKDGQPKQDLNYVGQDGGSRGGAGDLDDDVPF